MFRLRKPTSPVRLRIAVGGDLCPGPHGSAIAREGRAAGVFAPLAPFLADADLALRRKQPPAPLRSGRLFCIRDAGKGV